MSGHFTKMKTTSWPPVNRQGVMLTSGGCLSCMTCSRSDLWLSYQSSLRSFLPADSVLGTSTLPGHLPNPFTIARVSSTCLDGWKGRSLTLFSGQRTSFFSPSWNLGKTRGVLTLCSVCKALHLEEKKPASRSFSEIRKSVSDGTHAGWRLALSNAFDDPVLWKGHEFQN